MANRKNNPNKRTLSGNSGVYTPSYVSNIVRVGDNYQLSLNLGQAKRPEKKYTAEYCGLKRSPNGNYCLMFSEYNPVTEKAAHTVVVKFSDIGLLNFWKHSQAFVESVSRFVESKYSKLEPTSEFSENVASLQANMAFVGHRDGDLVFCFYNFDGRNAKAIAQGTMLPGEDWVEPVVEIQSTLRSAHNLFEQIRIACGEVVAQYPQLHQSILPEELGKGAAK
jgi:hypothetical protein